MDNANYDVVVDEIDKELKSIATNDGKTTLNDIVKNGDTLVEFIKKYSKDKFDSNNSYLFPIETKEGKKTINTENNIIINDDNAEDIKFDGKGIRIYFSFNDDIYHYLYIGGFEKGKWADNGKLITYHSDDGTVEGIREYKNGKLHGEEIEYYESRRIKCKRHYVNGIQEGEEIKYYDEEGEKIKYKIHYKNGELYGKSIYYCHTSRGKNKKDYERYYVNGILEEEIGYYDDEEGEKIKYKFHYKNGEERQKEVYYNRNGSKSFEIYCNKEMLPASYFFMDRKKNGGYWTILYNNDSKNSIDHISYRYVNKNTKKIYIYSYIYNQSNTFENTGMIIDEIKQIDKTAGEKLEQYISSELENRRKYTTISGENYTKAVIGGLERLRKEVEKRQSAFEKVLIKNNKKSKIDVNSRRNNTKNNNNKPNYNKIKSKYAKASILNFAFKTTKLLTVINNGLNKLKTINNIKDISNMDIFKNNKNSKKNKVNNGINNNNNNINNKYNQQQKELSNILSKIKKRANEYIDCIVNHLYDSDVKTNDHTILSGLPKATSPKSNSIRDYAIFRAVNSYLKNEKKLSKVSAVLNELYKDREINKDYNLIKHKENWYTYNILQNNNILQNKLNILNNKLEILEDKFVRNNREEIVNGTGNEIEKKNNLMKLKKANFDMYVKEHSLYNKLMEIDKSIEEEIEEEIII